MKQVVIFLFLSVFLFSCSKSDSCWCNAGDGEYEYLSSSNNVDGNTQFGDLEDECELEKRRLQENVSNDSYCEMR